MTSDVRPARSHCRAIARGRFSLTMMVAVIMTIGATVSGCGAPSPRDLAGYELTLPVGWRQTDADRYLVPGKALEAWEGPEGASLAIFETLPIPNATTESLLEETANRWVNLPEWSIADREMAQVGGAKVGRIEVVAPGSGDSLAPTGQGKAIDPKGRPLKPTRRLAVLIPLPDRTLYLFFHAPENAAQSLQPQWSEILASLKLKPRKSIAAAGY